MNFKIWVGQYGGKRQFLSCRTSVGYVIQKSKYVLYLPGFLYTHKQSSRGAL